MADNLNNPNQETGVENTGVEPGSETDRLLDAATRRIGNEPDDDGSFGSFQDADADAVRGNRDVTTGDHGATPVQDERSADGLGVDDTARPER